MPSKRQAWNLIRTEIRAGRMHKPDNCELCGATGQVSGHHYRGYAHPLDVWWVCVSCNTKLDKHDGSQTKEQARRHVGGTKKTDNANLAAKLELRRYFLRRYHADGSAQVLDCCQGSGVIWRELRKEFTVANYWGLDVKPKKGRMKLDSVRVLAQAGWPQDVIDVDTYGSPWKHWAAMLPNIARPVTVFLTIGYGTNSNRMSAEQKRAFGLGDLPIPPVIEGRLVTDIRPCLALALSAGLEVVECQESAYQTAIRNRVPARYIGVRLSPAAVGGSNQSPDGLSDGLAAGGPSLALPAQGV